MTPNDYFSFGSKLGKLLKIFGQLKFVRRLHDFLLHGGRRSRVEALADAAKVVLELEVADAQRIQNTQAIVQLMRDAGFADEEIQAKLSDRLAVEGVRDALNALTLYVDNGSVSIRVVSANEQPTGRPGQAGDWPSVMVSVSPMKINITQPMHSVIYGPAAGTEGKPLSEGPGTADDKAQ